MANLKERGVTKLRKRAKELCECPVAATFGGVGLAMLLQLRVISPRGAVRLARFTKLSLSEADCVGDEKNYPQHPRKAWETILYYHGNLFEKDEIQDLSGEGLEKAFDLKMKIHLEKLGLNRPEIIDWFRANVAIEHVAGGGRVDELPKGWLEYLSVDLGEGRNFSLLDRDGIVRRRPEKDEMIVNYRVVSNCRYAAAYLAAAGLKNDQRIVAALMIYQMATDSFHQKNSGEPTYDDLMRVLKERDDGYGWANEIAWIARTFRMRVSMAMIVSEVTKILCGLSAREEWGEKASKGREAGLNPGYSLPSRRDTS